MVESLRPVLASTKAAPGGQRTTQQQPFNTALIMTMDRGIEQHGIKRTARQLGITPHAVKRARRSHMSNLAAGAAADWTAAPLRRGRRCLSQDQLEYVRNFFEEHSSPSPMYKDVWRYYVRLTAGTCMSVPCLPCMKPDTTTPLEPMPMFQDTVKEVHISPISPLASLC
ncbi:hypothetical protein V8C86DRAFT_3034633 [Haematococcus lacustris]